MPETTFNDLISKAKAGDQAATQQLYADTRDSAYFIAKCYVKTEPEVAKLLQDTYTAAIGRLADYDGARPFESWLYWILAKKTTALLRGKKVKLEALDAPPAPDAEILPAGWADNPERRWGIMRIIEGLPEGQRIAILSHYLGGNTSPELSSAMGISPGAASAHLVAAKAAITANIPPSSDMSADGEGPNMARLLKIEAAASQMPPEMAKSVYQDILLFFMSGGKVASLDSGAKSADKGNFFLRNLPVLILVAAFAAFGIVYYTSYRSQQQQIAAPLIEAYQANKAQALADGDDWPGVTSEREDDAEASEQEGLYGEGDGEIETTADQPDQDQPPDESSAEQEAAASSTESPASNDNLSAFAGL